MDEVLAVGDTNFQSKCMEEFKKYHELGKTVVLVTHDMRTVERHCDRAVLIRDGRAETIGHPRDVTNKYLFQNIDDEERRKSAMGKKSEETQGVNSKKSSKVAQIRRVAFIGRGGKERNTFQTGEDITARIHFEVFKEIDKLNFGFGLLSEDNHYLLGINTDSDKVNMESSMKRGYVEIKFPEIPLRDGAYYIRFSIVKDDFSLPFDMLQRSQSFRIISSDKCEGLVKLKYEWVL